MFGCSVMISAINLYVTQEYEKFKKQEQDKKEDNNCEKK